MFSCEVAIGWCCAVSGSIGSIGVGTWWWLRAQRTEARGFDTFWLSPAFSRGNDKIRMDQHLKDCNSYKNILMFNLSSVPAASCDHAAVCQFEWNRWRYMLLLVQVLETYCIWFWKFTLRCVKGTCWGHSAQLPKQKWVAVKFYFDCD